MSELAASHYRQAIRIAGEGDHARAVELLERARILVRDNDALRNQVLLLLAREYAAVGRPDQAARCREQLAALQPPPVAAPIPPAVRPTPKPIAPLRVPSSLPVGRPNRWLLFALPTAIFLLAGLVTGGALYVHHHGSLKAQAQGLTMPTTTRPAVAVIPPPTTGPAIAPTTQIASVVKVVPPVVAVVKPIPVVVPKPAPVAPLIKVDRQELLKDTVGICVVVVRYEGPVGDKNFLVELPVGTGTAFCVDSSGTMLTNRHVVEAAKEAKLPDTLDDDHLPFVTLRDISYIVCFGPNAKDRYPARVVHKSKDFDMAVLKITRHCERPLSVATRTIRQGDDVLVCGYPGAVMAALNESSNTPARIKDMTRKWQTTRHVEPFDEFSPDSFNSTLTRGIVSSPDRHVEGASYVQIDAAISPGNSGGPVMNLDNEVLGIATWMLRPPADGAVGANYNFALGMTQLSAELRGYLKN